jgi:PhzF family phenazine biosynthesis protein
VRIRVVDAFTDRAFAGNPAGVCVVERWPDAPWMQRIAAELNLSETAFARPRPDGDWDLRWFTPTVEVDLCGHATLATAHALAEDELIDDVVRFHTRSGVLTVRVGDDVTLDFPAAARTEPANIDGLAQALGVEPQEVYWVPALREILAVLDVSRTVRELQPDLPAVRRLDGIRGVIVSACASGDEDVDFVSRVFLPSVGIPEDPVTGGGHTALAPFWARRLGRDELVGYQASARGGLVRTRLKNERVELTGRAVTVIDGALVARC